MSKRFPLMFCTLCAKENPKKKITKRIQLILFDASGRSSYVAHFTQSTPSPSDFQLSALRCKPQTSLGQVRSWQAIRQYKCCELSLYTCVSSSSAVLQKTKTKLLRDRNLLTQSARPIYSVSQMTGQSTMARYVCMYISRLAILEIFGSACRIY